MVRATLNAGISPLDDAHGKALSGDPEGALRACLALLARGPAELGAALLAGEILADRGRDEGAVELAARLVDGYVRRGDLPSAAAAACLAQRTDPKRAAALRKDIALAFGKASARLADVPQAPPPLPGEPKRDAALEALGGDGLLDRAQVDLDAFLAVDDPAPTDARLPRLPLFAALEAGALARLFGTLTLRDHASGDTIVEQGTEGKEAFVVVRGMVEATRAGEDGDPVVLAGLGPGAIFGEMALVSDAPRAASVVAVEPTRLLVVTREALEKQAKAEPAIAQELGAFCRARMLANLMRHSAILSAVDPEARGALMARFETRHFEPDDALVRAGDELGCLYLLASGHVRVTGTDADGDAIELAILGPGDVVGEISLVLRRPATADVVATHATVALELGHEAFREAIKDHPELLSELYELATRREEETRSVVAQEALDLEDAVLL